MTIENLVDLLRSTVERNPEREAVGTRHGREWTFVRYRELAQRVDQARAGLASLGVEPGDRVAVLSSNRLDWLTVAFALAGLSAVLVPISPSQSPREWKAAVEDSRAKLLFVAGDRVTAAVGSILRDLHTLERVIRFDGSEGDPDSFDAVLRRGERLPVDAIRPPSESLAEIVYTPGTTGRPKGVLLTHGNVTSAVAALDAVFPLGPDERTLSTLPWAHVLGHVGEVYHCLSVGASIAINQDVKKVLDQMDEVRPTMMVVVPSVFNRIHESIQREIAHESSIKQALFRQGVAAADRKSRTGHAGALGAIALTVDDPLFFAKIRSHLGGRLKWLFSGGARLDPYAAAVLSAVGVEVFEGYGLTEASGAVTLQTAGARKPGTVGRPLPGARITIDPSQDRSDGAGEIVVHGPMISPGYFERPEEQSRAFTPDGGLRTGDVGYLDPEGCLVLCGRSKEQYKLDNGRYVSPARLEETLLRSPYVHQAFVHGEGRPYNVALIVPDRAGLEAWAKREHRFPGPDEDTAQAVVERDVQTRLRDRASYEVPRRVGLLETAFSVENGMLTETGEIRRDRVLAAYGEMIDALYRIQEEGVSIAVAL
jgi:long-chain acyl-CoA synthetase